MKSSIGHDQLAADEIFNNFYIISCLQSLINICEVSVSCISLGRSIRVTSIKEILKRGKIGLLELHIVPRTVKKM